MDNASFNKILIRYCLRLTSAVLIGQQIECKQFVHGFLKCITFLKYRCMSRMWCYPFLLNDAYNTFKI